MSRAAGVEALETVLAVTGLAALAIVGRADGLLAALAIGGVALAPAVRDRLPRSVSLAVGMGTLVAVLLAVASGGGVEVAVGAGVVGLTLHQRLRAAEPGVDRVLLLLVTLLLVASGSGTTSPAFLPCWALWSLALPRALAGGGGRVRGAIAAGVLPVALVLFAVLPRRPALGVLPAEGVIGLSDEVRLATPPVLRDDPSEVARVRFLDGPVETVVLRGAALEDFDGQRWTGAVPLRPSPRWAAGPGRRVEVHHAALGGLVLVPGTVVRFDRAAFDQDVGDAWRGPWDREVDYTAEVQHGAAVGAPTLRRDERERALALPPGVDPGIAALAASWTAGAVAPVERVQALRDGLAGFRYTRSVPPGAQDPLAAFLLDHHSGHCELFAASVAVLARLDGLPARVVTGFVGGRRDGEAWVFRASDAHAWAEVHLEGVGWVAVDATPGAALPTEPGAPPIPGPEARVPEAVSAPVLAARLEAVWDTWVVGFDGPEQAALWEATVGDAALPGGWVAWVGLLVGVVLVRSGVAAAVWRSLRRPAPRAGVAGAWDRAVDALARRGLRAPGELGVLDAGEWLAARLTPEAALAVRRLAWLHAEVRFGGEDGAPREREALRLARALVAPSGEGPGDAHGPTPTSAPR